MPRLRANQYPAYRKHKGTGQAVVTLNGKDHYLGIHGTHASKDAYDRLIAVWLANGKRLPDPAAGPTDVTVNEIMAAYLKHAAAYYVKDGKATAELDCIKSTMRP